MKKNLLLMFCFLFLAFTGFSQVLIADFEDGGTDLSFTYFGATNDGTQSVVIANPNAAGINTSAKVTQFDKPANSETWAGAFSAPATPIDVANGTKICIDVYIDHIGPVALKLERTQTDAWITTQTNTKMNEWEQLCYNLSTPAIEGAPEPASGVYPTLVMFFDFGNKEDFDRVYYLDNIVQDIGDPVDDFDVTFQVNMSEYTGSINKVFVRGEFNGWGTDNELADMGSGNYSVTLPLSPGVYQYKYWIDDGSADGVWEVFDGLGTCTQTTIDGPNIFVNRKSSVLEDITFDNVCFASCYACGDEVKITFQLGMGAVTPSPDGVWLAGGGNFDNPGGPYQMSDDDMDGIYEITVPRQKGFTGAYTFANGNCPDYSCKEDISGLACAVGPYNDRLLGATDADVTVATCFGICSDNTACTVGTNDLVFDDQLFSLQPNIVNDFTTLVFNEQAREEKLIYVYDALGQLQSSDKISDTVHQLNTRTLSSGIYFVQVRTGNVISTQKFIRE